MAIGKYCHEYPRKEAGRGGESGRLKERSVKSSLGQV